MTHFHQVCEASQHCIRVLLSPASQTGSAPAWQWIPYFLHLASRHCGWDWLSSLKHSHANFHCGLLFISSAAPAIKPGNMLGPECAHLGHCPLFCSPKSLHPLLPFLLVLSYVVSTSWVSRRLESVENCKPKTGNREVCMSWRRLRNTRGNLKPCSKGAGTSPLNPPKPFTPSQLGRPRKTLISPMVWQNQNQLLTGKTTAQYKLKPIGFRIDLLNTGNVQH